MFGKEVYKTVVSTGIFLPWENNNSKERSNGLSTGLLRHCTFCFISHFFRFVRHLSLHIILHHILLSAKATPAMGAENIYNCLILSFGFCGAIYQCNKSISSKIKYKLFNTYMKKSL